MTALSFGPSFLWHNVRPRGRQRRVLQFGLGFGLDRVEGEAEMRRATVVGARLAIGTEKRGGGEMIIHISETTLRTELDGMHYSKSDRKGKYVNAFLVAYTCLTLSLKLMSYMKIAIYKNALSNRPQLYRKCQCKRCELKKRSRMHPALGECVKYSQF
jgi:hypothetical protein